MRSPSVRLARVRPTPRIARRKPLLLLPPSFAFRRGTPKPLTVDPSPPAPLTPLITVESSSAPPPPPPPPPPQTTTITVISIASVTWTLAAAAVLSIASASAAFCLVLLPASRSLDASMRQTERAAKEMEALMLRTQKELPETFNEVQRAAREWEELGKELRLIGKNVSGTLAQPTTLTKETLDYASAGISRFGADIAVRLLIFSILYSIEIFKMEC